MLSLDQRKLMNESIRKIHEENLCLEEFIDKASKVNIEQVAQDLPDTIEQCIDTLMSKSKEINELKNEYDRLSRELHSIQTKEIFLSNTGVLLSFTNNELNKAEELIKNIDLELGF